jgi:hypothetical protein
MYALHIFHIRSCFGTKDHTGARTKLSKSARYQMNNQERMVGFSFKNNTYLFDGIFFSGIAPLGCQVYLSCGVFGLDSHLTNIFLCFFSFS